MTPRSAILAGALAIGGIAAGAVAGMEAGGSIDGFYAATPPPRYRTPLVDPSTGWDGATSAAYPVSTPAVPMAIDDWSDQWAQERDRDGLPPEASFRHRRVEAAADDGPVRIHRADDAVGPDVDDAAPPDDDAEDGRVEPAAPPDIEQG